MGAGQSGGIEVGGSTMGYQVLRVYPNSPGSRAGLKAYFDFIVAIGTTRFNKENGSLREILKASIEQKLKMVVYNTRTKSVREVEIVPSTNWGGNGLLGVSIKHSSFDRADERVWHVVEVEPGSPAQQAGFKANEDFVIGSDSILQENDDLYNLIETHEGKALKLFVYNVNQDNCREVICHPNSRWGGRGYLGCEFGHGLLHRIPFASNNGDISESSKASLIRNQQPAAVQEPPMVSMNNNSMINKASTTASTMPTSAPNPGAFSFSSQLMQQQQSGRTSQPGHQLFQQALLGHDPYKQKQQQQQAVLDQQGPLPPPTIPQPVQMSRVKQRYPAPSFDGNNLHQHQQQQQPHQQQPGGYNHQVPLLLQQQFEQLHMPLAPPPQAPPARQISPPPQAPPAQQISPPPQAPPARQISPPPQHPPQQQQQQQAPPPVPQTFEQLSMYQQQHQQQPGGYNHQAPLLLQQQFEQLHMPLAPPPQAPPARQISPPPQHPPQQQQQQQQQAPPLVPQTFEQLSMYQQQHQQLSPPPQ